MYGLRKDIDLNFLNGRQVEQVAIGVYQIQFGFDEDVRISTYMQFNYFDGREEWIWKPEPGAAQIAARTVALLGATDRKPPKTRGRHLEAHLLQPTAPDHL